MFAGILLKFALRRFSIHNSEGRFGRLAEWSGRGLQNLVRRFDSATDLPQKGNVFIAFFIAAHFVEEQFRLFYLF